MPGTTSEPTSSSDPWRETAINGRPVPDALADAPEWLIRLRTNGFHLAPLPNLFGDVDGILASRLRDGQWVDSVMVRGADCAVAARVRNNLNPDTLFQCTSPHWSHIGDASETVDAVLSEHTGKQPSRLDSPAEGPHDGRARFTTESPPSSGAGQELWASER